MPDNPCGGSPVKPERAASVPEFDERLEELIRTECSKENDPC